MPKYNFLCKTCQTKTHKYVSPTIETITCPSCGATMDRELPIIDSQTEVKEIVDPYLNKRLIKDHKEVLKERRNKYYVDVEIPRLVEKYSLQTCLENKWLIYNDKGELVINKNWTPPSK